MTSPVGSRSTLTPCAMDHLGASLSIHTQPSFGTWCALDSEPGACLFTEPSLCCRYAIKGSPNQKLLLEDIYYAIESRVRILFRFPFTSSATHTKTVPILQDRPTRMEGTLLLSSP